MALLQRSRSLPNIHFAQYEELPPPCLPPRDYPSRPPPCLPPRDYPSRPPSRCVPPSLPPRDYEAAAPQLPERNFGPPPPIPERSVKITKRRVPPLPAGSPRLPSINEYANDGCWSWRFSERPSFKKSKIYPYDSLSEWQCGPTYQQRSYNI